MDQEKPNFQNDHQQSAENSLTGIPSAYTLAATQNDPEIESEADMIIISNFINTLAEIALAVASRNHGEAK